MNKPIINISLLPMTYEFFLKYLFSKTAGSLIRTISWIGFLGVAIGVMSMVVVLNVMNGLGDNMKSRLLAIEPHLIFNTQTQAQQKELLNKFAPHPDTYAFSFEQQDVLIRTSSGLYEGAIAKGMERAALVKTIQKIQQQNDSFTNKSIVINDGEIFMGMGLARSLGVFEEDEVVIIAPESLLLPPGEAPKFDRVKVVGIIDVPDSKMVSKTIFYKKGKTFTSLGQTASLNKGVEVRLDDPDDYGKYSDVADSSLTVESWASRNSNFFYSLKMEKLLISILLSLTLLISNFAIITVLILLGIQKRQDMGLLMTLGLSPKKIRRFMMNISLLLSILGLFAGLLFGIVISLLLNDVTLSSLPDIYYDTTIPVKLDFIGVGLIALLALCISIISSWFSAFLTIEKSPALALRPKF